MIPTQPCVGKDNAEAFFKSQRTREYRENLVRSGPSSQPQTIRTLSWNALGNRIAAVSAAHNTNIRIWNPERPDARFSTELKGHTGAIECVAWDPTFSDRLVSCSGLDGTVRSWEGRQNQTLQIFRAKVAVGFDPVFVRYSPDGRWIIVCGATSRQVVVLEAASLTVSKADGATYTSEEPGAYVTRAVVAFSGSIIAIAFSSGIVKFLEFDSNAGSIGQELHSISAHRAAIGCMEFDPRGSYLALGSSDSLVSIWDLRELVCVRTLSKSSQPIKSLSFSFDGAYLAVSSEMSEPVEIVYVESGTRVFTVPRISLFNVPAVEWHPTKYWLAYAGDPAGLKIMGTDTRQ